MPAGQGGADAESARQQLNHSYQQLAPNLTPEWRQYLAPPADILTANTAPNPQSLQQVTSRYEEVSRNPQFAALNTRPDFQDALRSLKRLGEVRTASNSTLNLPPPPR